MVIRTGVACAAVAGGQRGVGLNVDAAEQLLDIRASNAFGLELVRPDFAVDERGRQQVFQVVVGLLLGRRSVFAPEAAATGDVEGGLKHLHLNRCDVAMLDAALTGK